MICQSLFPELSSPEEIRNRNVQRLDKQLMQRGVSAIQRGVITLMTSHPNLKIDGNQRCLVISLPDAADWIREFSPACRGMACWPANIVRGLKYWLTIGVVHHAKITGRTVITLDVESFQNWFDEQPDFDDISGTVEFVKSVAGHSRPLPVVAGHSRPLPVVAGHSRPLPVIAGHSRESESESNLNEDDHLHSNQSEPSDGGTQPATENPPNWPEVVPDDLWTVSEPDLRIRLRDFAGVPRFEWFVGAILYVRNAKKPPSGRPKNHAALYYRTRGRPAPYLESNGIKWLTRPSPPRTIQGDDQINEQRREYDELESRYGDAIDRLEYSEAVALLNPFQRQHVDCHPARSKLLRAATLKGFANQLAENVG